MRLKKMFTMILVVAVVSLLVMLPTSAISAADLSKLSDQLSTIKAGTVANHTITFTTPTGVAAAGTIVITFPAGFTIGTVAFGDIDLSYGATGTETEVVLAASPATTTWGAAFAGQVLTFTSATGTIAAGSVVVVEIGTNATSGTNRITNPTAGTYQINITGTFGDDGEIAVVIVANDEVAVTGRVLPTLSFSLSANTTDFGDISASAVDTADTNITLTISTNGTDGYTVTVKDKGDGTAAGLWSAAAGNLIASSAATLAVGTEGYGIQAAVGTGAATIATAYLKTATVVGALTTTAATLASNAAPANGDTVVVKHMAEISNITEAGDYVDTITYNVTANF